MEMFHIFLEHLGCFSSSGRIFEKLIGVIAASLDYAKQCKFLQDEPNGYALN